MTEKTEDEKEVERKRDAALHRALSTPHKPHQKGEVEKERKAKGNWKKS
jgi:hypothetical protein